MLRSLIALAVAGLVFLGGCARIEITGVTPLKASSLANLQEYVLTHAAELEQFRLRGPFAVTVQEDYQVPLTADERIEADLYLSAGTEKAPLVILLHGYDNTKEDHAYQALHLATWGMHSLAVQLPNNGPWTGNGKTLARLVSSIRRHPELVDKRVDPDRIVLVGHSFGASSVAVALAEGAPAVGAILLDPAGVGKALPNYLSNIRTPVMVLGADQRVTLTRNRGYFYAYIRSGVAEISITDAHHEDAQFPLDSIPQAPETDSFATEELQITFVSALTSAAVSLGFTGKLDYAWKSFAGAIRNGKLFDAMRK